MQRKNSRKRKAVEDLPETAVYWLLLRIRIGRNKSSYSKNGFLVAANEFVEE